MDFSRSTTISLRIAKKIKMKKLLSLIIAFTFLGLYAVAQDEEATTDGPKQKFTRATFNSTRVINQHSVETVGKGTLQFLISHHFSEIWNKDAAGADNLAALLGLNSGVAHTYLSFDMCPTDWSNVGVSMAGASKYEGWLKFRLLRQQTGKKNVPVSVSWLSLGGFSAAKVNDPNAFTWNKFSYLHQLMIARKFSDKLSLQIMPSMVHFNIVPFGANNSNNVLSLGAAAKLKLSGTKNLTCEYSRQLNMYENLIDKNGNLVQYNPDLLSVGMEFKTGGHVFQFYVGNTTASSIIDQLARNTTSIKDGHFAFGFTFNRSLMLGK